LVNADVTAYYIYAYGYDTLANATVTSRGTVGYAYCYGTRGCAEATFVPTWNRLYCNGAQACQDTNMNLNNGFVYCGSHEGAGGVSGACENAKIVFENSTNPLVNQLTCSSKEGCKGVSVENAKTISCTGHDSCQGLQIKDTDPELDFSCQGSGCDGIAVDSASSSPGGPLSCRVEDANGTDITSNLWLDNVGATEDILCTGTECVGAPVKYCQSVLCQSAGSCRKTTFEHVTTVGCASNAACKDATFANVEKLLCSQLGCMELEAGTTGIDSLGVLFPGAGPGSWATNLGNSGPSCQAVVVPPGLAKKGLFKRGPGNPPHDKSNALPGALAMDCPENPVVPCDPNMPDPGLNRKQRRAGRF